MAQYTNPDHTSGATLTTGELVNSTIANIDKTGADAYARVLDLKTDASATDLIVTADGTVNVSANAVVDGFTLINGGATPTMRVSTGATVRNGTTDGTVSLYVYGGSAVNVDMGAGGYWNVNTNGVVDGGSFNGKRLGIGGSTKGTVKNLVIKTTDAGEGSNCVQAKGELIDCTISKGAIFRVSGGQAVRTIVSGANARLVVSTGSANSTMLYADGSATVIGGTATDTIASGGTLFVSSNGTADGASVFTGGRLVAYSGATVTGVAESGGYVSVAKGAAVTFVETDLTGFTFTKNATVHESTTAKNVTVADGATLVVCASSGTAMGHGTVDGATIRAGGSMDFEEGVWAWETGNWASACNVTVEAGGTLKLKNFAKALDVQAGSGAFITRESNRTVIGGANTNIAKGVISDNGFGDDFEVVNGVATGLFLTGDTTTGRSAGDFTDGITVKDAVIVSGASLYLYDGAKIDGIDLYGTKADGTTEAYLNMYCVTGGGIRIGSGGSAVVRPATGETELDGIDVFSGGTMTIQHGAATNLTVSSGGSVTIENGAHGNATVGQSGVLNFNGGTAEKLTVDGTGSDTTRLNVRGGTVETVNVKKGGGVVIAGADTVVSSLEVDKANKIWVSNGATVSGGYTKGSFELRLENGGGTLTDFSVGSGTYLYFSAGYVSGVTVASDAGLLRFYGSSVDALTLENCTIYKQKVDGDNRGFIRGRMFDCRIMSGGYLRQTGGSNTGLTISGGTLDMSGGVLSNATAESGGQLLVSGGVGRDLHLSGCIAATSETASGSIVNYVVTPTSAIVLSGAVISGALIEDYAVVQVNAGAALYDPILRMNNPTSLTDKAAKNWKYARINIGNTGIEGGLVSGGVIAGNGNTVEFFMYSGGVASDVTFDRGAYVGVSSGALVSGGTMKDGTISMRGGLVRGTVIAGGTANFNNHGGTLDGITVRGTGVVSAANANVVVSGATILSGGKMNVTAAVQTADNVVSAGGSVIVFHGGNITGTIIRDGGMMVMSSGATVTDTTISSGGYLEAAGKVKSGVVNGLTVLSGGKFLLTANSASVVGLNAEAGAVISLSFTNATAATAAAFDTLADCNTTIELLNVGSATKTFNVATTGNTNQQFAMLGSGIFEGTFKAGDTYVDPFTTQQLVVAADATTIDVTSYTRTSTGDAATFAQSGSVINGGDKELMWTNVDLGSSKVALIDTDAAAAITGDAWMDIQSGAAISGAAIYGTDKNVTFGGKIRYQLHGPGDTVGNVAFGANYGGSVKGVEILTYNTTYQGVCYAGGFGDVDGEIDVIVAGGNTFQKDFYMGALYNANKVAANTTTSVGDIKATFGEKAADSITVRGNIYGASAVKAGTVTTAATLHTVGDVELTLKAGTLTDKKCVFAGGYATGHDTAKAAPVYTVKSVTATITGGSWGTAHGGRGIFGGAMASDNIVDGDEAAGVYAQVGNVNMTISGGTMGNVYGGGWAQKGAKSEVGDVNITVTGGTIANVFGGGSTSKSGGSTVAGNVTITVSGGTISNAIYARGQSATDVTGTASVVFTGSKSFTFADGVYGYSFVGGAGEGAALSFSSYTGSFSGAIGGFSGITFDGATAMTLGTAYGDVTNGAWTFDAAERDEALAGTAFLNWSDADFTGDTITLNLTTGKTVAWDLVSADTGTVYNKFDVRIDNASILSETIDIDDAIAGTGTAYDGWGFTNENGTLKFKQLA